MSIEITINGIPYVSPTAEAEHAFEIALASGEIGAVRTMIADASQRSDAWLLALFANRLPWRKFQGNGAITDELMLIAIDAVANSYTETDWKGWLHAMHFLMASTHLLSDHRELKGEGYAEQRRIIASRIEGLYKKVFDVAMAHDMEGLSEKDWLIRGMPHQLIQGFVMAALWNADAEKFGITAEVVGRFYCAGSHTGKVRSREMLEKERERLTGQHRHGFCSEGLGCVWEMERDIELRKDLLARAAREPSLRAVLDVQGIEADLEKLREQLFAKQLLLSADKG